MLRGFAFLVPVVLSGGCFNPDDPGGGTETDTSTGGTAMPTVTMATTATATTTPTMSGTLDSTSSSGSESGSSTGDEVPDWGEGEPPDFGDLGPDGEGGILVVHALDFDGDVDVWLVGASSPIATDLASEDGVLLEGVERDARRVVLAQAGTLDAVGCSEWFPLRADEQWAVVSARGSHTCPDSGADGGSMTFEQDLSLSENPLRFAHAAAPDDLTVLRGGTPEAGVLEPLQTLSVEALPDCSASGCQLAYQLENSGLALLRDFTFLATEVADVPPPGEVVLVVTGDIREDWPREASALKLLRVDVDGAVRPIERDPEIAVAAADAGGDVTFSVPALPGTFDFAIVVPCAGPDPCALPTQRFIPGSQQITGTDPSGAQATGDFDLAAGHRYLIVFTTVGASELTLIDDEFDRADGTVATGRAFNVDPTGETLTIGRVFGGNPQPFDAFVDIPSLGVTTEQDLPTGGWDLIAATGAEVLGTSCFSRTTTAAGWRGIVSELFLLELDQWPPLDTPLQVLCF